VTTLPLAAYRGAATVAGALAPLLRPIGPPGSAWRSAWTGATPDLADAAGSVWVHAASLGEMVAARTWIETLLASGQRSPLLLTARTERGLKRARTDLGEKVIARVAPLDLPQLLRSFLRAAAPWRLDVIETELWPHLILESRRRGVAVVFVSAAGSERTRTRLLRWGLAGPNVLGEGVWVLAQSDRHAERFRSLGVPSGRIEVTGDLKAERPAEGASRGVAERPAVVFGSLRPGEEGMAAALARGLASQGSRALVLAPRHAKGLALALAALEREGIPVSVRRDEDRGSAMRDWIAGLPAGTRVGVLATQGELPCAYESAAVAIVGGTFAPYGGHSALEAAARGCAVVVGPHAGAIEESVEALAREGAALRVADPGQGVPAVLSLLGDPGVLRRMGEGAERAAALASDSARRSLRALERFGLTP